MRNAQHCFMGTGNIGAEEDKRTRKANIRFGGFGRVYFAVFGLVYRTENSCQGGRRLGSRMALVAAGAVLVAGGKLAVFEAK